MVGWITVFAPPLTKNIAEQLRFFFQLPLKSSENIADSEQVYIIGEAMTSETVPERTSRMTSKNNVTNYKTRKACLEMLAPKVS